MEYRRRSARPSALRATELLSGCEHTAPAASALRPGQVVSGRAVAALGARCTGARTASRSGAIAALFADEHRTDGTPRRDAGASSSALAARLGLTESTSRPATRTSATTCGASAGCRSTSIRSTRASTTSSSASACAASSTQGLDAAVGYVLPSTDAAASALEHRPVVSARRAAVPDPGDSPMGLRLPLESLPWVGGRSRLTDRHDRRSVLAASRAAAASAEMHREPPVSSRRRAPSAAPPPGAPCAEPANRPRGLSAPRSASSRATACSTFSCRRSRTLDDYLELVAAIEATSRGRSASPSSWKATRRRRSAPESSSGHARSRRHRGQRSPARSWDELVEQTTHLYEEARQLRLDTEKFMLDGRHTGTGGGNHFVLGGATPADSPLLGGRTCCESRGLLAQPSVPLVPVLGPVPRPDEPGPRVDEARHDSLYELEIAFSHICRRFPSDARASMVARSGAPASAR